AYGAPSTRYRESTMDRVVEKWVYADLGKVFSFEDGKLVETANFMPGSILSYGEFPTGIIVSR
ncbi:MAG TPA: hypothetical protein VMU02_06050, partial [bacterium]|nr:hypothetical protein [bacterium]